MRRIMLLFYCLLIGLGSFDAFSQKDILLYSTDFTDWNPVAFSGGSSNAVAVTTGAGAGFTLTQDMSVVPSAGKLWVEGGTSGRALTFKPFNFISGGVVELLFDLTGASSARKIELTGFTITQCKIDYFNVTSGTPSGMLIGTTAQTAAGGWIAGSSVTLPKNCSGQIRISMYVPSITGSQTFIASEMRKDIPLREIKVYSSVETKPYVASTNYAQPPVSGHIMTASVGGAKYSGTATNSLINIKEWNSSSNVLLSIEGADAAKFSFSNTSDVISTTVANATALAGSNVTLYFSPSVRPGVASAKLKIVDAAGAITPYYVNLTGVTSNSSSPQIMTDTATVPFWTYTGAPVTNTIDISGLNLSGDLTLSVTGANASRFSLSNTLIKKADASVGTSLTITYTGANDPAIQAATLVITSAGATTVTVPLTGYTYDLKPKMYNLDFVLKPSGTGYVNTSPQGTTFMSGTKVTVVVTPESGYYVKSWDDLGVSAKTTRVIEVGDLHKGTIIITLDNACLSCECQPGGCPVADLGFILNDIAPSSITDTGFNNVSWSADASATGYIIKVYDSSGTTVIQTLNIPAGTTTTNITGLTKATQYKISVETVGISPSKQSGIKGPYKTTGSNFTCGQ